MGFTTEEIILDSLTADPSAPVNGCMWYRSDLNEIRARINGVTEVFMNVSNRPTNKLNATVAPGGNDDSTVGYAVGSLWVDEVAGNHYTCVDATATAAVWKSAGATGPAGSDGASGDIAWQGDWVSQNYTANQAVKYSDGCSYVCILNTVSSEIPTDATYWDVLAEKGDVGSLDYSESVDLITTTAVSAWVTRTRGGDANKIVQVIVENDSDITVTAGVRTYGASIARTITIGKNSSIIFTVKLDGTGQFEIYGSSANILFEKFGNF